MKKQFSLLILVSCFAVLNAQGMEYGKLADDEGFGKIKIDGKMSSLESMLIPCERADLWMDLYSEDMITSTWTVDLKKAGMADYFGLKIERIEVQFETSYNPETGEEEGEDIFEFTIFTKQPADADYNTFMKKVEDYYGPIISSAIHEDGTTSPEWFTDITMVSVGGKGVFKEVKGVKYIFAHFQQAYGG